MQMMMMMMKEEEKAGGNYNNYNQESTINVIEKYPPKKLGKI